MDRIRLWGLRVAVAAVVGASGAAPAFATKTPAPIPGSWVIESADYTGTVQDRIARFEARYRIRLFQEGWVQVALAIPGATVTTARIEGGGRDAHLVPQGDGYLLVASRKGAYTVILTAAHQLLQDAQFEGVALGIPRATHSTFTLLVPRHEVELRPADRLFVEAQPDASRQGVKLIARVAGSDRIDLRWQTKPAAPVIIQPVLYGEVQTLVTIEEELARLMTVVDYRIAQGHASRLELRLPAGISVRNVRGAGIAEWRIAEAAGHQALTVSLGAPLHDATYQLILEGEQALPSGDAAYALPEIELAGVNQERGHVAVASSGSVEIAPQAVEGLHRIDVRELPSLLRGTGEGPVLAFRYHQHPYRASLSLDRHDDHPVLAAIAEQGELLTVIAPSGELLTRAVYLLKANKKQFLDVALPEGAALWSCLVDGRTVKPAQGEAGHVRVPLRTPEGREAVPVELVYFSRRAPLVRLGDLRLEGPVLDVPTTVADWVLYAPRDVRFLRFGGNVTRGVAAVTFANDAFAYAAELPASPVDAAREEIEKKGGAFMNSIARLAADMNAPEDERVDEVRGALERMRETGILPLKIRVPQAGRVYRFSRLLTDDEALQVQGTFVRVPAPWVLFGAVLLVLPLGGLMALRLRRA